MTTTTETDWVRLIDVSVTRDEADEFEYRIDLKFQGAPSWYFRTKNIDATLTRLRYLLGNRVQRSKIARLIIAESLVCERPTEPMFFGSGFGDGFYDRVYPRISAT